jgi:hypothetical protein
MDGDLELQQKRMDGILELQQEPDIEMELWYCSKSRWRWSFRTAARADSDEARADKEVF